MSEELVSELDRADVMAPPPECSDETKEQACVDAKSKQWARRQALRARLKEQLERFMEEERLLGAEVTLQKSEGLVMFQIDSGPCEGGYKTGSVPVRDGLLIDEVRVGYGLYQTAWTDSDGTAHGDGRFHPGIVVERKTPLGFGQLRETYCILLDGTPRPPLMGDGAQPSSSSPPTI